jgi:cytochrome c5
MRCKRKTPDVNPHHYMSSNGKNMVKSKCSACHGNKNAIVASGMHKKKKHEW